MLQVIIYNDKRFLRSMVIEQGQMVNDTKGVIRVQVNNKAITKILIDVIEETERSEAVVFRSWTLYQQTVVRLTASAEGRLC